MRINKFLAENGVASRRHADAMVAAGRIKINGQTASLGTDVSDEDEVSIDDKPLERAEKKPEYYLMNKPKYSFVRRPTIEGARRWSICFPRARDGYFP